MNSRQRRKINRRLVRTAAKLGTPHLLIRDWEELAKVPESSTHRLEIEIKACSGWIIDKARPNAYGHYLSTHTFYGSNHAASTRLLRQCGFNVTLAN